MSQALHYIAIESRFELRKKEGNSKYPSFEVGV